MMKTEAFIDYRSNTHVKIVTGRKKSRIRSDR